MPEAAALVRFAAEAAPRKTGTLPPPTINEEEPVKPLFTAIALAGALGAAASSATAQAVPYIGQVTIFPYNFCPENWVEADGRLLPISQNTALYSLYGTTFGGDGRTSFGIPDLRGRTPMGIGQGDGLSPRAQGQRVGAETVTMTVNNLPNHTHGASGTLNASGSAANTESPESALLAETSTPIYVEGGGSVIPMAEDSAEVFVESTGGNQPIGIVQPSLVLRYCVALTGAYPPRD